MAPISSRNGDTAIDLPEATLVVRTWLCANTDSKYERLLLILDGARANGGNRRVNL